MTVGRILLGCKVGLDLFWQHDGSFECLHMRYIHVGLVFFLPFGMWPSQVVSYRGDLFKLLHTSAISAILRYFFKFVWHIKLGNQRLTRFAFWKNVDRFSGVWDGVRRQLFRLPSRYFSNKLFASQRSVGTGSSHTFRSVEDWKGDAFVDPLRGEWIVNLLIVSQPSEPINVRLNRLSSWNES